MVAVGKVGSVKTAEQMKAEYREVISLLRKGYSIRDVAKLSGKGVSTVQRVKRIVNKWYLLLPMQIKTTKKLKLTLEVFILKRNVGISA